MEWARRAFAIILTYIRNHKNTSIAALAIVIGFLLLTIFWLTSRDYERIGEIKLIAVAGGAVNQMPFSMNVDALDYNYSQGLRAFQIGLSMNAGEVVCRRDYSIGWRAAPNTIAGVDAVTLMPSTPAGFNDPCTGKDWIEWANEHPDTQFVLWIDPAAQTQVLQFVGEKLEKFNRRVIVLLEDPAQQEAVATLGFSHALWFIRSGNYDRETLISTLEKPHHFVAVALPLTILNRDLVRMLERRFDIQSFTYVLNSCSNLEAAQRVGARATFTDQLGISSCSGVNRMQNLLAPNS